MILLLEIIALAYLIFSNRSLSSRLNALELKEWSGTGKREADVVKTESLNTVQSISQTPVSASNFIPLEKQEPNKFTAWLKEDWLMKLGALLFIVGFGWFVSYAFANNWVGPIGRISIGIVAGIIIMALGFKRMMRYPSQGALFMALGAGMAMLTIFAGRSIYDFFTPASAVAFDFIIVAFISFASYKFNVRSLAFLAQILAFVTPLLVAGGENSVFLFSYLFFISLATLFLASVTGWRGLINSSLIFVGLYSLPYIAGFGVTSNDNAILLNFAYLFSMLYLLSGMFAVVKKGIESPKSEITMAVLNGLFLFIWIYNVADSEWKSLLFALWAIIFAVSSFIAFRFSSKLAPFYAYGSVAVGFIAAATATELHGTALTIAFTVEVLLLVVSVLTLTKSTKAAMTTSWLFLVPVLLSFNSISGYSNSQELFTKDFFALAFLAIALVVAGRLITHFAVQKEQETDKNVGSALVVFATLYAGYILWQFIHILISTDPDLATMATLILYTIFGLIAYFVGLYSNDMARRTYGVALLAFVVIRLVFVDVWHMALFGRVITFLAIGVLLMSTAFLTKKKKHELELTH